MINLCFKFIICFTKPELPKKKSQKLKPSKVKPKTSLKNKQLKPPVSQGPVEDNSEDNIDKTVTCGETRDWCLIEYSLLANVLPKVQIYVVTWGEVAKIYIEGDSRSVKTVLINDVVWVYFEIIHKINPLNNEDLLKFKESKISFTFSQDSKTMVPRVAKDCPKRFEFVDEIDDKEKQNLFLELHQIDPPDDEYCTFKMKLESFKMTRPDDTAIVTMINVKTCEKCVELKINDVTSKLPVASNSLNVAIKGGKKSLGAKRKKAEKQGKTVEARSDARQLVIDNELLIAGKCNVFSERNEISETLRYAGVFAEASKILTDEQELTFVPLVVNIQTLESLPLTYFHELNVQKIFARYEFANVFHEVETPIFSLEEKITIDDTKVFFLSSPKEELVHAELMERPSMILLAEALLTCRFVVRIYGEIGPQEFESVTPCIFGDRPTDPFISTPGHEMFLNYKPPSESREVFLGSAYFNLIQLVKGHSSIEACSVFTSSPLSSVDQNCDFNDITGSSPNEPSRKAFLSRFSSSGLVPESMFHDHNTTVKLKVRSLCKLTVPGGQILLKIPHISHRAIIIFKGNRYNDEVVDIISSANAVLFDKFATPDESQSLKSKGSDIKEEHSNTDITGFFVEHEHESILVIEAMTYVIPPLIHKFQDFVKFKDYTRIICDSSIFFSKRLYSKFHPRHIYRIKLPLSLNELLKTSSFYSTKNAHNESLQALLLLDLLRRCSTLNSACIHQLFPSCTQLVSFHKIFGVEEKTEFTMSY